MAVTDRIRSFFIKETPQTKLLAELAKPITHSMFANKLTELNSKGIITGKAFSFTDKGNEITMPHPDNGESLYQDIYMKVAVAKTAIDYTADFAVQAGFQLEGSDSDKKAVEEFIDRVNLKLMMANWLKQMQIFGNAYVEVFGDIDSNLKILPPTQMFVIVSKGTNDGEILGYKQMNPLSQQEIVRFDPEEVIHFKWNEIGASFYGISDLKAVVSTITRLVNYQEDMGEIIHRYGNPLMHWTVGSSESPGSAAQVSDFINNVLNKRETGEDIVTSTTVKAEPISHNLRMIQPDGFLKHLENQLIAGLKVPEIFIRGGETSNKATADVELQAFDRKVKSIRNAMTTIIEDKIFPLVAKEKVTISWNAMNIESEEIKSNMLTNLKNSGVPLSVALKMVGWGSWVDDVEAEKEKEPDIPPMQPGFPPPPQQKQFPNDQEFVKAYDAWKNYVRYLKEIT